MTGLVNEKMQKSSYILNTLLDQNTNTPDLQDICTCQNNEVKAEKRTRFWSMSTVKKALDHSCSQNHGNNIHLSVQTPMTNACIYKLLKKKVILLNKCARYD